MRFFVVPFKAREAPLSCEAFYLNLLARRCGPGLFFTSAFALGVVVAIVLDCFSFLSPWNSIFHVSWNELYFLFVSSLASFLACEAFCVEPDGCCDELFSRMPLRPVVVIFLFWLNLVGKLVQGNWRYEAGGLAYRGLTLV